MTGGGEACAAPDLGAAWTAASAATNPSNRLGLRFWAERANREAIRAENGAVNALKDRSK